MSPSAHPKDEEFPIKRDGRVTPIYCYTEKCINYTWPYLWDPEKGFCDGCLKIPRVCVKRFMTEEQVKAAHERHVARERDLWDNEWDD